MFDRSLFFAGRIARSTRNFAAACTAREKLAVQSGTAKRYAFALDNKRPRNSSRSFNCPAERSSPSFKASLERLFFRLPARENVSNFS